MKILNFLRKDMTKAVDHAMTRAICTFEFEQVHEELKQRFNTYMPEDQYEALKTLIRIQMELDICDRREGRGEHPHYSSTEEILGEDGEINLSD